MQNETQVFERMLCDYIAKMVHWLRQMPPERWDWSPAVSAPTPRQVAEHTWVTLVCDRQHLEQPDVSLHPLVPDPPEEPDALCTALLAEADWWRQWLSEQTPQTYLAARKQFGAAPVNVRWLVYHSTQQVVYKLGQLSTLYYALGLDGTEPYQAPFPNEYYLRYRQHLATPLIAAILREDVEETARLLREGADPNAPASDGSLPLLFALTLRNLGLTQLLLTEGADPSLPDGQGYTARQVAVWTKEPALIALFPETP